MVGSENFLECVPAKFFLKLEKKNYVMMEDEKKNRCNKYILLYLRNYICYNNYINEYNVFICSYHISFFITNLYFLFTLEKKVNYYFQGLNIMHYSLKLSSKKITILSIMI